MKGGFARKSNENYSYYWKKNFWVTTSGQFTTPGLKYVTSEMSVDRVLFSIGELTLSLRDIEIDFADYIRSSLF